MKNKKRVFKKAMSLVETEGYSCNCLGFAVNRDDSDDPERVATVDKYKNSLLSRRVVGLDFFSPGAVLVRIYAKYCWWVGQWCFGYDLTAWALPLYYDCDQYQWSVGFLCFYALRTDMRYD